VVLYFTVSFNEKEIRRHLEEISTTLHILLEMVYAAIELRVKYRIANQAYGAYGNSCGVASISRVPLVVHYVRYVIAGQFATAY
jgi:hypothetical protein